MPEEFQAGGDDVLILTDVYWQPPVCGWTLAWSDEPCGSTAGPCTIVGVLPPNVLRYGADFLKPLVTAAYPA